jgi:hypothetical protein
MVLKNRIAFRKINLSEALNVMQRIFYSHNCGRYRNDRTSTVASESIVQPHPRMFREAPMARFEPRCFRQRMSHALNLRRRVSKHLSHT